MHTLEHKDWYGAAELVAIGLPGVRRSKSGVLRQADDQGWRRRARKVAGGERFEFHIRSLPEEARIALAEKLLGLGGCNAFMTASESLGGTAHLKGYQREVLEARAALLAEVDRLVELGTSRGQAVGTLVSLAKERALGPDLQELVAVANARSGRKSSASHGPDQRAGKKGPSPIEPEQRAARSLSRSTVYAWIKARDRRGVEALAPRAIAKGPLIPRWAPALMDLYARPQKPSLAFVMEELPKVLSPEVPLPSYDQARRFLGTLSAVSRQKGRMGNRALKAMRAYVARDTKDTWPGAVYAADGHRFDAEVAHPRHGRPFRPEITSVIDVYTRKVVGWSVALEENTWGVLDAARHAFESAGLPDIWYVDRGKGFNNRCWDDELTGFLARLGISKRNSLPYNAQARGIVERVHRSIWVRGAKTLPTYMGHDMDREARQKMYRLTRRDIRMSGKSSHLIPWQSFLVWCGEQVESYNTRPHTSLPRERDSGTGRRRHLSPDGMWRQATAGGEQSARLAPDLQDDLFRPYEKRRARRGLVSLFGNRYFLSNLEAWHDEQVLVGYDIHDASKVWVRDGEHRLIGIARFEGNAESFFPVEALERARRERKAGRLRRLDARRHEILVEAGEEPIYGEAAGHEETTEPAVGFPGRATGALNGGSSGRSNNGGQEDEKSAEQRPNCSTDSVCGRPVFEGDAEWVLWLLGSPEGISDEDRALLKHKWRDNSFRLLMATHGIDGERVRMMTSAPAVGEPPPIGQSKDGQALAGQALASQAR